MLRFKGLAAIFIALLATPAIAEMNGTLRIGVLNDMSSVYADFQGPGSVVAAQMAVEDYAKQSKRKVEVLSGDHGIEGRMGRLQDRRHDPGRQGVPAAERRRLPAGQGQLSGVAPERQRRQYRAMTGAPA
jgi:hypothetical protein